MKELFVTKSGHIENQSDRLHKGFSIVQSHCDKKVLQMSSLIMSEIYNKIVLQET